MSEQSLAAAEDNIVGWLETHFGGSVVEFTRQPRWRPVWFATVDRADGHHELVVRGDRTDMPVIFPLLHEMTFQRLLDQHGIPVAQVHGWINEPTAYVMDHVTGEADFAGATDAERDAVVDEYLTILARLHSLAIAPFMAAGIHRAEDPAEAGRTGLRRYEQHYRTLKSHPDPFLEFCLGWLRRNPIQTQGREAPIVWDSGQFHHQDGRITAILDLELGHIGDPMMDLAAWRMRDTVIDYGNMADLYARYEELSGSPVDLDAIRHHHMVFTLSNLLAYSHALREPTPASDLMTNLHWCCETNLFATEAWAEHLGINLPTVNMPAPRLSIADVGHHHMVRSLRSIEADSAFGRHQLRTLFRLARHLQRCHEIGDELDDADLNDLESLLGTRPHNPYEGEAKLEAFVLADTAGIHDNELVALFHKRHLRAHMLLGPAGSAMTRHHSIQRFQ